MISATAVRRRLIEISAKIIIYNCSFFRCIACVINFYKFYHQSINQFMNGIGEMRIRHFHALVLNKLTLIVFCWRQDEKIRFAWDIIILISFFCYAILILWNNKKIDAIIKFYQFNDFFFRRNQFEIILQLNVQQKPHCEEVNFFPSHEFSIYIELSWLINV